MAWSRNNRCNYKYTVKVDLNAIVDAIIDALPGSLNDWDYDGDNLVFEMSDTALADVWYCRQTLESPEEYEVELKSCIYDVDVYGEIISALRGIEKIGVDYDYDYESIEIEPEEEPDPDRAYDEWRDRQWEGED